MASDEICRGVKDVGSDGIARRTVPIARNENAELVLFRDGALKLRTPNAVGAAIERLRLSIEAMTFSAGWTVEHGRGDDTAAAVIKTRRMTAAQHAVKAVTEAPSAKFGESYVVMDKPRIVQWLVSLS